MSKDKEPVPGAENRTRIVYRVGETLVVITKDGIFAQARKKNHPRLSEPMTEVEFIKLLEDISGAKNSEYIRPCEHRFIPCDSEREYTESDQENCMDISQKYSC